MPLTYPAPDAARNAAEAAIRAHSGLERPLQGVRGVRIAESLTEGLITLEDLARIHRFFVRFTEPYLREVAQLRTEEDSAEILSWNLHGAEAGKAWAARQYKEAVEEGLIQEDPILELFELDPEEVYDRFSLDGWRIEYGLDSRTAATFVRHYMETTNKPLDLVRAFGESARAVGNAIYRKFHEPDPFRQAYRALLVRDAEYRLAASLDMEHLAASPSDAASLSESLKPQAWQMNPKAAAKIIWGQYVAYFILAVEKPTLIEVLNKSSKKPPTLGQTPAPYTQYIDPVNTYITYFHPKGAKYVDPMGTKFDSIDAEMEDAITRAWYGRPLKAKPIQTLLGRARRWMADNKLAGSLFHVFNADWKKANWQHILDNIPQDAHVRPPFEEFVKENPLPKAGVKLQQTLSSKEKKSVLDYLSTEYPDESDPKPVKISTTKSAKEAEKKKTPLGVYSVLRVPTGTRYTVMGAYKFEGDPDPHIVLMKQETGVLSDTDDSDLAEHIEAGTVVVVQAHADMPGTVYGEKPETPSDAGATPPEPTTDDEVIEYLKANFQDWEHLEPAVLKTYAEAQKLGLEFGAGTQIQNDDGKVFIVRGTFMVQEEDGSSFGFVYESPEGSLHWAGDEQMVKAMKAGALHFPEAPPPIEPAAPPQTEPPGEEKKPPKFSAGDIVKGGESPDRKSVV